MRQALFELDLAIARLRLSFLEALPETWRGRLLLIVAMLAVLELVIVILWLFGVSG